MAGGYTGLTQHVVVASRTTGGITWAVEWNEAPVLNAIGADGTLLSSRALLPSTNSFDQFNSSDQHELRKTVALVARGHRVNVAIENQLHMFHKSVQTKSIEYDHKITSIAVSAVNTRERIAVMFSQGGILRWNDLLNQK